MKREKWSDSLEDRCGEIEDSLHFLVTGTRDDKMILGRVIVKAWKQRG